MAFLIHMSLRKQDAGIFIGNVLWLLLSCSFSFGVESDINCLKSIKASLEDTSGYLNSSWDFSNNTEGFICNFLGIECLHPHENKVQNIKLSNLGLKGSFPKGVANCTSLTGLDLSSNQLNGPLPTDIDKILPFVTSLDLSSNSFSGKIPVKLSNCSYLNVLELGNNKFSGTIPPELGQFPQCLANCTGFTDVTDLNLSSNHLQGPLPADICHIIPDITFLDLSNNSFSGQIPDLSNCVWLYLLKLDNNEFSGHIPPELGLLPKLKSFSVANNQLSGQVPDFSDNISVGPESYANNSGLCGKPLKPCRSQKKPVRFVKVLSSNRVLIAAAAGFGFSFPFSFCFFLPRSPSVRYLVVFTRRFKS